MTEILFFPSRRDLTIAEIVELTGAECSDTSRLSHSVASIAPLDRAQPRDLAFLDNAHYRNDLIATHAGACFIAPKNRALVPERTVALVSDQPYRDFAAVAALMFPAAMSPRPIFGNNGIFPGATIHADARIEPGVSIDPGVVIGPGAHIGSGTTIAANTVIGPDVHIGRNCHIGAGVTIVHALIGNNVIIQSGARLGQDGFGFAIGRGSHTKVPQIGRVVIQDHVELGALACVDRGANRDTIIGEGTKIDNQVQIAHNVVIGRHCLIAGQVGIAGSTVLEDFVILGGQVGITGHVRIGTGTQVAGGSNVISSVAPGSKIGGSPARPIKQWFREVAVVSRLARQLRAGDAGAHASDHDSVSEGE